jgi:hypothetical protein
MDGWIEGRACKASIKGGGRKRRQMQYASVSQRSEQRLQGLCTTETNEYVQMICRYEQRMTVVVTVERNHNGGPDDWEDTGNKARQGTDERGAEGDSN